MHRIQRAVALALSSSLLFASVANAQGLPATEVAPDATDIDTIVVLGTGRADVTALTSTAPVDVVTPEELKQAGAVTINQALSRLHPSFNFPQGQNAVKGQGVRAASLRGVGPAYTLILVNGKRRNVSAQLTGTDPWPAAQVVDINTIPLDAVERIEVLRDGAAAQYGSDAIAGVVNIVLKSNASEGGITGRVGSYTDGGGETWQVTANKGFSIGDRGLVQISIDRLKNDNVDRSEADWRQLFPNGDPRNQTYPAKYGQWGQSERDNWTALVNAGFDITANLHAYGWANYADKSALNYVNPERIVKANTASATATNPTRVSETASPALFPNGYQPYLVYTADDANAAAGLKYDDETLGSFDLGVSFGTNETGRTVYNTLNPSWGLASPTSFYLGSWKNRTTSVTLDYSRDLPIVFATSAVISAGALYRNEHWATADFGNYIGYTSGPLGGLTVASLYGAGGIYNPYVSQFPGVNFATDISVVPATGSSTTGVQPVDASAVSRQVHGGYAGVDFKLFDKLDVGLTGRYENYSDFGDTTTYRATARYEFVPAFALRGTVSTGFHAPSIAALGQQSTGYTSTFTNNGSSVLTPGRTRLFRSADPLAARFGARPLEPEKSTTYSLGFVVRPDDTSSITVDAYRLDIQDVITNSDPIQGPTVTAAFAGIGLAGYTQASYYLNAWDAKTEGVDIVGRKHFMLPAGRLELTAATSFLNTDVRNIHDTVTVGGATLRVLTNARERDAESGTPRNKVVLAGRYDLQGWTLDLAGTRYSKYRYNVGAVPGVATANGNIDQTFGPEFYLDAAIGYQANNGLRTDLQVQNVLNDYPEKYVNGNRSSGINPYSFIAPNGASGRFVQLSLSYGF